jgi:hypothetical protein
VGVGKREREEMEVEQAPYYLPTNKSQGNPNQKFFSNQSQNLSSSGRAYQQPVSMNHSQHQGSYGNNSGNNGPHYGNPQPQRGGYQGPPNCYQPGYAQQQPQRNNFLQGQSPASYQAQYELP